MREIKYGKTLFYVQLICKGTPSSKAKNKPSKKLIGADLGPSTIAIVGDNKTRLELLCSKLESIEYKIRILQRKMGHERRINNPNDHNPDGTIKKGKLKWKNSKTYRNTRNKYAEINRRHAEYRKSLQGRLANEIIRQGNKIYIEKMSYKGCKRHLANQQGKEPQESW